MQERGRRKTSQHAACRPTCKRKRLRNRNLATPQNLATLPRQAVRRCRARATPPGRSPTLDIATPPRQEFAHCSEGGLPPREVQSCLPPRSPEERHSDGRDGHPARRRSRRSTRASRPERTSVPLKQVALSDSRCLQGCQTPERRSTPPAHANCFAIPCVRAHAERQWVAVDQRGVHDVGLNDKAR